MIVIWAPPYHVVGANSNTDKLCGKPHYMPPPLRTVRPSSSPYTPYACGAQRALLPVTVGAMNIHDVRDTQTGDNQTDVNTDVQCS